jgi:flagellar M-ring protein FliF
VGNMNEFFGKLRTQLTEIWGKLNLWKRLTILGVVIGGILGVVALFATQEREPYEYIFENISAEDSQAITSFFQRENYTDYVIDGRGIKVRSSDVMQTRLKLAQEGLPSHGQIGWEKFDNSEFTRTEFEQRIHRLRAIQGELSRTISSIESVTYARVHIVEPQKSVFVEDQKDATAAVYIKTKRGQTLDKKQIKAIQHLVSRSVEGLKPTNVTIIDADGQMLTEIEAEDAATRLTKEMLEHKKSIERKYEDNIRMMVGRIVGPDRVEVKVDAEVDFTQEEQTISDIDPDRTTPISKNTTSFSLEGKGLNPTGIPGAKSNVPGEQEQLTIATNQAENKKDSEITNFEISRTMRKRTLPVGTVTRLTTAVIVDGSQEYPIDGTTPDFIPRSEEEMKQLDELVKTAVGFRPDRDVVTVRNMMFQLNPYQVSEIREKKKETREYISTLALSAAVALALVLFFAFVVRPYFRWLSYDPDRKQKQQIVEEFRPDLEVGGIQNVQVKEDVPFEKLTPQEQILYLAKNEPKRTTEAIRLMLNPHQTAA